MINNIRSQLQNIGTLCRVKEKILFDKTSYFEEKIIAIRHLLASTWLNNGHSILAYMVSGWTQQK